MNRDVQQRLLDANGFAVKNLGPPAAARDATFTDNASVPTAIGRTGQAGANNSKAVEIARSGIDGAPIFDLRKHRFRRSGFDAVLLKAGQCPHGLEPLAWHSAKRHTTVAPAKAGVQAGTATAAASGVSRTSIPACAGMTA